MANPKNATNPNIDLGKTKREVAQHLNQDVGYPIHAHALDENGKPSMKIGKFERRCSFQSLEFVADDDFSAPVDLITVERI